MARNNKNSKPAVTETETSALDKVAPTATSESKSSKPGRNRRQRPNRNNRENKMLKGVNLQTPNKRGDVLVFPTDSAAMQSFGDRTTAPGQDNAIEQWSRVLHKPGITDVPVNVMAAVPATRAANAMRLDITHFFGSVATAADSLWVSPIMSAGLALKQFIDTSFGTVTSYDANDLMTYVMGISAVFPWAAEIRRDLRLVNTYLAKQYPQFVPSGLFALLGITNAEGEYIHGEGAIYTAQHLRSLVDYFNQVLIAFNQFPIPPELPIFRYNDDFFEYIYTDSDDYETAQLYVFKNRYIWAYSDAMNLNAETELERSAPLSYSDLQDKFNPREEDREVGDPIIPGARLIPWDVTAPETVYQKIQRLAELVTRISTLRTSDNNMLKNLFNAYGSRDTIKIPLIDFDGLTPLEFKYDENMMTTIENAVLLPKTFGMTYVQSDANTGGIEAHLYVPSALNADMYFNLPLQFHKPSADVSDNDIGYAMRLHPVFNNQKKFTRYDATYPTGAVDSHVTADGYTGFAILSEIATAQLSDGNHNLMVFEFDGGRDASGMDITHFQTLNDFHRAPMFVQFEVTSESPEFVYTLLGYTSHRDVEVTYRLEDASLFWTHLTQTMWGAGVDRNVPGSRTKFYS